MFKKPLALSCLISVAFITGCSSSSTPVSETSPQIDTSEIDRSIIAIIDDSKVPGIAISIVSTQSGVPRYFSKGYGVTNIDTQAPVDENTAFWMGSVSKSVLGTLLQMAKEQGIVDLDEDIRPVIVGASGFSIDNPSDRAISLRSLATHSSGIADSDDYVCGYYVNSDDGGAETLIDYVGEDFGLDCDVEAALSLPNYLAAYLDRDGIYYNADDNFTSDIGFEYSNVGAGLAGYYLELKSGLSLHELAAAQLFEPLEMRNTGWTADSLSNSQIATNHVVDEGDVTILPQYELATYPDGGLRSSASDMTRFLSLIMSNGMWNQGQLLQPASIQELITPSEFNDEQGFFFELDLGVGHSGEDPGAASFILYDPETNLGIAMIANGDLDDVADEDLFELLELLLEAAEEL